MRQLFQFEHLRQGFRTQSGEVLRSQERKKDWRKQRRNNASFEPFYSSQIGDPA